MAITRTPIVDDSGTGTDGTVLNNAWKTQLYDQIDAALYTGRYAIGGSSDSGVKNDWAPTGLTTQNLFIEWNAGANLICTGITIGQTAGQMITIRNVGGAIATFGHANAGSTNPNRFLLNLNSSPIPIAPGGWITFVFDGSIWVGIAHEQGSWITPPYNAALFTTSTAGIVWTVDAGDVESMGYYIKGNTITLAFALNNTSVSSPVANLRLNNGLWGGFGLLARRVIVPFMHNDNAAGLNTSSWLETPPFGGSFLTLARIAGLWSVSTNNTGVYGEITFEIY